MQPQTAGADARGTEREVAAQFFQSCRAFARMVWFGACLSSPNTFYNSAER